MLLNFSLPISILAFFSLPSLSLMGCEGFSLGYSLAEEVQMEFPASVQLFPHL
jgi:hypothetical protein